MRNFWMEARVEGRTTVPVCGPRAKNGGMTIDLRMMDKGNSLLAYRIVCTECDGKLTATVVDCEDNIVVASKTKERR